MSMLEDNKIEKSENIDEHNEINELTPVQMEYLQQTEGLNQDTWDRFSLDQRLIALNTIEAKFAEITGREPMEISIGSKDLPDGKQAVIENEKIHVSSSALENPINGEHIIGSILGLSLGNNEPLEFNFQNHSDYEIVNNQASGDKGHSISFTGNYKYCTPSSCSGWARDGEYVSCS